MDYLKFKEFHEDLKAIENIALIGNKQSKEYKNMLHLMQNAFDGLFNEYSRQQSYELPVWLFGLFDEFVKLIEHSGKTLQNKWEEVLNLAKELHVHTYLHLGPQKAKGIYTNPAAKLRVQEIAA